MAIPQPQATPVAIPLPLPLPHTLPSHLIAKQHINLGHRIEQSSPLAESPKIQGYDQHQDLVSRLASLFGSHLDCPASDFERSTNLADRDLDSVLRMERMNDVEKMSGVSTDLSILVGDGNFDHLADILVSAVAPLGPTATTHSSTAAFTLVRLSGLVTPITVPDGGIDETHILTRTTKTSFISSSSTIDVLAGAAREFESIKGDFDNLADEYGFSDFYGKIYDKQAHLVLAYAVEAFSELGINLSSLGPGKKIPRV